MNQEESEQNEVDGMKKGADSRQLMDTVFVCVTAAQSSTAL